LRFAAALGLAAFSFGALAAFPFLAGFAVFAVLAFAVLALALAGFSFAGSAFAVLGFAALRLFGVDLVGLDVDAGAFFGFDAERFVVAFFVPRRFYFFSLFFSVFSVSVLVF